MPTKEQLLKFVRTRNASEFDSNLQVQFDAEACGFSVGALGPVEKKEAGDELIYEWQTGHGKLQEVRSPYTRTRWRLLGA